MERNDYSPLSNSRGLSHPEETHNGFVDFEDRIIKMQIDLSPEISKIVNDNFSKLLELKEVSK